MGRWLFRPLFVVVVFTLILFPISWLTIRYQLPDSILLLSMIPVVLSAVFYKRQVYFAMMLIAVMNGIWVTSYVSDSFETSLITILISAISGLLIAEILASLTRSRQRIIAALRESENKYRKLVEMLPYAIIIFQDGSIVFANQTAADLVGVDSADDLIGEEQPTELFDKDIWNLDRYQSESNGEKPSSPINFELVLKRSDGNEVPAQAVVKIISYQGQPAIQGVLEDVSERRRDETLLKELLERYRLVSEVTSDFAYMARVGENKEFVVEWGTDALSHMTGYSHNEIANYKDIIYLFHPEDHQAALDNRQHILAGNPDHIEIRLTKKDGNFLWVEHLARPIREPKNGKISKILGVIRDISVRKKTEEDQQNIITKRERLVEDLKIRRREDTLLIELGDLLQSCLTSLEVYTVVGQVAGRLFLKQKGAMYILDSQRDILESVISWGSSVVGETVFAPGDCWALRRGREHVYAPPGNRMSCPHVLKPVNLGETIELAYQPEDLPSADDMEKSVDQEDDFNIGQDNLTVPHLCIPLNAQGELLGVFHLQFVEGEKPQEMLRVANAMAGRVALALANLRLRETLDVQTYYDPVTGLFNHGRLIELLRQELRRSLISGRTIALALLDIDDFSAVNEFYGRDAGDVVLKSLGNLFKEHIRRGEYVGRFGGDGFLLVFPGTELDEALERTDHLRAIVSDLRIPHNDQVLDDITISGSIAGFPLHGKQLEEILFAAEVELKQAKFSGGNVILIAT